MEEQYSCTSAIYTIPQLFIDLFQEAGDLLAMVPDNYKALIPAVNKKSL
jgi:hypothetical protein